MQDFYFYFYSVNTNEDFQIEEQLIDFDMLKEIDEIFSQVLIEPDEEIVTKMLYSEF